MSGRHRNQQVPRPLFGPKGGVLRLTFGKTNDLWVRCIGWRTRTFARRWDVVAARADRIVLDGHLNALRRAGWRFGRWVMGARNCAALSGRFFGLAANPRRCLGLEAALALRAERWRAGGVS